MNDFFGGIAKDVDRDNIFLADDGVSSSEFAGFIDTGSYILNAAFSGSLYGGVPDNKITAFAGETTTGKTFFILGVIKHFLDTNPTAGVFYFDTESAVTKKMMAERGIDVKRVWIVEPESIQEFRHKALNILKEYMEKPESKRPRMMFALDSLGNMSSTKELEDTESGAETRDMTKGQILRATFRVLTLKLAKACVPMIVTNHVYDAIGCVDDSQTVKMADGSLKNITEIEVGDQVATISGPKNVSALFEYDVESYHELTFEDGKTVKCTPNHKFLLTSGEWKRADELVDGDDIAKLSETVSDSVISKAA